MLTWVLVLAAVLAQKRDATAYQWWFCSLSTTLSSGGRETSWRRRRCVVKIIYTYTYTIHLYNTIHRKEHAQGISRQQNN